MINIEHDGQESHDLVRLKGRLGAADGPDSADKMIEIFERGPGMMHVEMSELEWIDSGGLSALVNVLKRARKQEGDLVLLNPNERVRAVLEMTRLHEIFEIRDDMDDDDTDDLEDEKQAVGF